MMTLATHRSPSAAETAAPPPSPRQRPTPAFPLLLGTLSRTDLPLPALLANLMDEALRFVPCRRITLTLDADAPPYRAESPGDLPAHLAAVPVCAHGRGRLGHLHARADAPFTATQTERLAAVAGFAALAIRSARAEERERQATARRRLLDEISANLQQTLDLEELIARLFASVNRAIYAEAQSLWLVDEAAGRIECRFATGPGAEGVKQIAVPLGEGIVGSTVTRCESLLVDDAQTDTRHSRLAERKTGVVTRSLMSVPLVRAGRCIGAMQAINKHPGDDLDGRTAPFDADDLELLRSIADIAALCIENARLYADLERSRDGTLEALAAALDTRDHETEGHSRRVVEYAARLGREMGLSDADLRILRRGALIHDIGKIGVPDAILNKPGPLTADERAIIARHPETGWRMLAGVPALEREAEVVLSHHERWDGLGYPRRLRGTEIALNARLFAVADTLDAITSDRPYRRAATFAEARRIIGEESGHQFDPAVVAAFLHIPAADWEAIRARVDAEGRSAAPSGTSG